MLSFISPLLVNVNHKRGLTGAEANHGEDGSRTAGGKHDPEYELLDTGVFDGDRYWIVEVYYAKADPTDLLMSVQITNAGPELKTLHVLPTIWFRNTWSCDLDAPRPELAATGDASIGIRHPFLGELELMAAPGPDGTGPSLLFCENDSNDQRLYGVSPTTPYPKDGINDHVVSDAATVNPARRGTKCAAWYRVAVASRSTVQLRLRLRPQLYHYNVARWLDGDPASRCPPSPGSPGATPDGAISRPSMSCRCEDFTGSNLFEGGFLGLDNIGPLDRSRLPVGGTLEQSDATGWMATYALAMTTIAAILHYTGHRPALDLDQKFLEQFAEFLRREGLCDPEKLAEAGLLRGDPGHRRLLVGVVGLDRRMRLFSKLFDPEEFLSPYGLRAISAVHRDHPYEFELEGVHARVDYEPAESTTDMFGGNSNRRGPVWFPLSYPTTSALERYHRFFGDDLMVEYPTGSGRRLSLDAVAADLWGRLASIFLTGPDGRRPCFGWVERLQHDPNWKDNLMFNEYFHGDNAAGLGASHQTGWTGIVADVIRRRHRAVPSIANVIRTLADAGGREHSSPTR